MDGGVNGDKVAVLDLGIGWDLRVFYEMNRTQKRDTTDRDTAPHSLTGNSNTFKTIITYLSIYNLSIPWFHTALHNKYYNKRVYYHHIIIVYHHAVVVLSAFIAKHNPISKAEKFS
jgi:hypothetical protein